MQEVTWYEVKRSQTTAKVVDALVNEDIFVFRAFEASTPLYVPQWGPYGRKTGIVDRIGIVVIRWDDEHGRTDDEKTITYRKRVLRSLGETLGSPLYSTEESPAIPYSMWNSAHPFQFELWFGNKEKDVAVVLARAPHVVGSEPFKDHGDSLAELIRTEYQTLRSCDVADCIRPGFYEVLSPRPTLVLSRNGTEIQQHSVLGRSCEEHPATIVERHIDDLSLRDAQKVWAEHVNPWHVFDRYATAEKMRTHALDLLRKRREE